MRRSDHIWIPLLVGALFHAGGSLIWPQLLPLRILAMIVMLSGYIGLLSELGLDRPLNRLSALFALYAGMGHAVWLLSVPEQTSFGFLYVLCLFAAFFITSVAGLHRDGSMRRAGAIGAAASAVPLLALIGGHVALGGFGLLGAQIGGAALSGNGLNSWPADLLLAAWAIMAAMFVLVSGRR